MAAMGPLGDSYALRCVSDLPPPFRPVFGFRFVRGDAYAHQTPRLFFRFYIVLLQHSVWLHDRTQIVFFFFFFANAPR